jgi:8-oxo-dGTP pyrophosphatase MutT (NUDIX family)
MAEPKAGFVSDAGRYEGQVRYADTCTLTVTGAEWPFARAHALEIDAYWQQRTSANPGFFNGRIYMMSDYEIRDAAFEGRLLQVEFKAFLYWKNHGWPDRTVFDVFGSALIRADDGAILLGRQRAGNLNAGLVYLPGGFIDPRDVDDEGRVDIGQSILREVEEETGLHAHSLGVSDGYLITTIGQQVSIALEIIGDGDAATLQDRIAGALASDAEPELEEIVVVRKWDEAELLPMPSYAQVLLAHLFGAPLPDVA